MRHGPDMIVADFTQVDAFADRPFTGNPAAVIPLDGWLDDSILQAVAAENNLAETAFVVPATGSADYELRWFTPTVEVVLFGHATLARSEEHTSELQSLMRISYAVFCLKKKTLSFMIMICLVIVA